MMRRLLILLILCLIGLAGCSYYRTVGPFVTDVGYDDEGNLVITKNMIVYDYLDDDLSKGENPQTIVIKSPKR